MFDIKTHTQIKYNPEESMERWGNECSTWSSAGHRGESERFCSSLCVHSICQPARQVEQIGHSALAWPYRVLSETYCVDDLHYNRTPLYHPCCSRTSEAGATQLESSNKDQSSAFLLQVATSSSPQLLAPLLLIESIFSSAILKGYALLRLYTL